MADTTVNIDIQVQTKTLGQLEDELSLINEELKDVQIGSQAFKDLSKQAQDLTRQVDKANKEIEGFTFDEKIQSADGAIKLLGGSLASVVGTLGVLGVESEAFGDFEEKAASAIAVAVGFKDVSEGLMQMGPFLKQASTAVKGFSLTTKQALIATGIGAFVVLIGSVVAYWDDITAAVEKFGEKVPFVGKALDAIKEGFNTIIEAARPVLEFLGILPDEAERAIIATTKANDALIQSQSRELKLAQARGASARELYEIQKGILEAELENLRNAEAEKQEIYDKETELLVLQAAEKKRIAEENAKNIERETVATVNGIKAIGIAQVETAEIVAPTIDKVTAATLKAKAAQDLKNMQTEAAIEKERQNREGLAASADALSQLGSVLNQESAAAKALGISTAIINTYLGVTEVLKQKSTLPSPFDVITKIANVATILASGFKAVQGIKSTPVSGGGGGAPGNITAPVQGPRGMNLRGVEDVSAISPEPTTFQPTVRAYVVSGDVTSAQEADAKLNNKRTLGG